MTPFNYHDQLSWLPATWRDTAGEGIKIAIIDSGIDFSHPDLAHLDRHGRAFRTGRSDFDISTARGNDKVTDGRPSGVPHGSMVAGMIGAKAADPVHGLTGVCPEADITIIKAIDNDAEFFEPYFTNALEVALREEVDLVCVSGFPVAVGRVDTARREELFKRLKEAGIVVLGTLLNTKFTDELNAFQYPCDQDTTIVTGAVGRTLVESLGQDGTDPLSDRIDLVWPQVTLSHCVDTQDGFYREDELSSSLATALLTGAAGLALAAARAERGDPDHRMSRAELLSALAPHALAFSAATVLAESRLVPFHLRNPLV